MNCFSRSLVSTASVVATVAFFSSTASAQDAATPTGEATPAGVAAPDAVAPPAPQAAPTEEPTESNPSITSINPENDARADVKARSWPNRPLLVTGLVVLGGSYGASAIVGATSDRKADEKLFYPVVGPWMDLSDRGCDVQPCGSDTFNKALLISGGVIQGVGALGVLLSLVVPETTTTEWYLIGNADVNVAPQTGAITGLSAQGRF